MHVTLSAVHVRIHPAFDPQYYGFYWEGLRRLGARIEVSSAGFPDPDDVDFYVPRDCFAVLVGTSRSVKRLLISADDHAAVHKSHLEWCDRLGKVNIALADPLLGDDRILPIGPSFGIKAWGPLAAARMATLTRRRVRACDRSWSHDRLFYDQWRKRLPESDYQPGPSDSDYLFFTAWPWTKHPEVNPPRAEFIRACRRQVGLEFEGGFAPRRRGNPAELVDLLAPGRYALGEYVYNVQRSAAVFNNPAVHGCLGWKLGEFLALGKAIISTPLDRALPVPLRHGTDVHFVDGSAESLDDALIRVRSDADYRSSLEANARSYYECNLAPQAVVRRLLDGWDAT